MSGLAAGLLLAAALAALVPSRIVVRVGEPGGLVPPMLIGVHDPERNYGHWMRWTTGRARLRWPGRFGAEAVAVVVTLAGFPGRQPDQAEVRVNGQVSRHALSEQYTDIRIPLRRRATGPVDVEITSLTTRPPADPRTLGVRLEAVTIENAPVAARLRRAVRSVGVVVLGGLAWMVGLWAAGAGATRGRRLGAGVVAWGATALVAAMLAPTALRADTWLTLPPVIVGACVTVLLGRAGHAPVVAGLSGLVIAAQGLVIANWCAAAFVDVPRWDIWDIVPLLVRQETHGLTLVDILAPHNEHRPAVARLVMLGNVALSRWNHWNELWLMLAVTAAHVLTLVACLRYADRSRRLATAIVVAGIGTFVATATQWENFLQGWQVALVVGAASMSGAFLLLSVGMLTWRRLACSAALVLLGTASFGSCLLGWPLGAAALAARRERGWPVRTVVWLALGALTGIAYAHGLVRPPQLPPPSPVLTSLTALGEVAYGTGLALAMPVWYAPTAFVRGDPTTLWLSPAIGALAVVLSVALLAGHLLSPEGRRSHAWVFPGLLVAFGVGACGITAVGRVPLGMAAMTASRYIAFTALFWVGLLLLLTVAAPCRSRTGRAAGLALASLIVVAGMRAWGDSLTHFEQHYVTGVVGREALLREDWPKTQPIFPVPPVLDERRQALRRMRLSLYR